MFFRAYIVDPSLSENGQPIGGLKGTLKIMQKLLRETKPDRVVICWDGAGGSKKRRSLNKDYKDLGQKKSAMLRDMKATREQRIKRLEDSKQTFVGWIKRLMEDPDYSREIGIGMEKMRLSAQQEKTRLSE